MELSMNSQVEKNDGKEEKAPLEPNKRLILGQDKCVIVEGAVNLASGCTENIQRNNPG